MEKILNVALVGCGAISQNHLRAIANVPFVNVVALCDIVPEKAEKRKQEYNLTSRIYDNYEQMLNSEKLDAVHITTPHYLHADMTISALKRDINVFLEKPICINTEQIEKLLLAEKNSRGKVCVCFQNRFNPSTNIAKRIAAEDGGVKAAYGSVFWYRNEKYYTESGWRGAYATEGGGVMINQAIHTVDLLCEFLGTPRSVIATKANHHLKNVIEVEDTCEGIIFFDEGKRGNFYMTTSFEGRDSTTLYLVTAHHTIQIQNSNIYVDGEKVEDPALVKDFFGKECYGNGHMYLIEKFYHALRDGEQMPVALENAHYALRVLLAAYESNDCEVKINI